MFRLASTLVLASALLLGASRPAAAAAPAAAQMKNPTTGAPLRADEGASKHDVRGYQAFHGKGVRSVFDPQEPKTDATRTRSFGVAKGAKVDTSGFVTVKSGLWYSKGTHVWDSAAGRHKRTQRTMTLGRWSRTFPSKQRLLKP